MENPVTIWGQGYRPGSPRIVLPARSPPSRPGIVADLPVAANPGCRGPDTRRVDQGFLEEEAHPARADLVGEKNRV